MSLRLRLSVAFLICLFLAVPALIVYPLSFSDSRFLELSSHAISTRWYRQCLNAYWLDALGYSLVLGAATGFLSCVLAIPAAFVRIYYGSGRIAWTLLDLFALVPLLVPPIGLAVAYFRTFGEGGGLNLLLGHTVLGLPFAYFSVRFGFAGIDFLTADAATMLGAGPAGTLHRVWLPACWRHVCLGFALAFLVSWDETVLSVFLTVPETTTLPKAIWQVMQRERDLTPAAINAIAAPLLAGAVMVLVLPRRRTV